MDVSKLETNVKSCRECVVICYIFHVMYGKKCLLKWIIKVFQLMDQCV
jgi:hypothetical protein